MLMHTITITTLLVHIGKTKYLLVHTVILKLKYFHIKNLSNNSYISNSANSVSNRQPWSNLFKNVNTIEVNRDTRQFPYRQTTKSKEGHFKYKIHNGNILDTSVNKAKTPKTPFFYCQAGNNASIDDTYDVSFLLFLFKKNSFFQIFFH